MSVLVERSSPSVVPQRVGGADRAGARIRRRQRQRALLVRNGDVGADKAVQRQPQHEIAQILRRDRLDDVAALDAERAQPVMMDQRRARMRRRPSDQAGGGGLGAVIVCPLRCRRRRSIPHRASRLRCQCARRRIAATIAAQRQRHAGGKPDRGEIDPVIGRARRTPSPPPAPPITAGSAPSPSARRRSARPR